MAATYTDEVTIHATQAQVWAFLDDPDALGRVLPGCERIERSRPGAFALVLIMQLAFLSVRADATATLEDAEPPRRVRLTIDGSPRDIGVSFRVSVPFELEGTESRKGSPLTRVRYGVEVELTGSVAMFGTGSVHDAMRRKVVELAANVDREVAAGRAPGGSPT